MNLMTVSVQFGNWNPTWRAWNAANLGGQLREAGVNEPLSTSRFRDDDTQERIDEYNFQRAGLTF